MDFDMPPEFARFLSAVVSRDAESIAKSFAETAVVIDVGRKISGRISIREWARDEIVGEAHSYRVLESTRAVNRYSFILSISSSRLARTARYDISVFGGLITRAILENYEERRISD